MLRVVPFIFLAITNVAAFNQNSWSDEIFDIFEVEGIFSTAHIIAIERQFEEYSYNEISYNEDGSSQLRHFVIQYGAEGYHPSSIKQIEELLDKHSSITADLWIGPNKTKIDYKLIDVNLRKFDLVGMVPGTTLLNVEFNDDVRERFCSVNTCDFANNSILITNQEGSYRGYAVVGSLNSFLNQFFIYDDTTSSLNFFKPSLFERLYISISNPSFAYLFFTLGFALIGLELFAMGPGIMAFLGGVLIFFSSMTFQELEVNLYGILLFLLSFLIYIKVLSRGYFSAMGALALLLQFLSSLLMFSDYIFGENIKQTISVNITLLALVSIGLGFFYFVAIPTVIRSRLTTDNSSVASLAGNSAEFIRRIDSEYSLFNIKSLEIKIRHTENQKFVKNKPYEVIEKDGSLVIQ